MKFPASKSAFILLLLFFNFIPLYGVFQWGWKSFDLIFLYWLENLVIGIIMILRMVIRPYSHVIELALPVFLVPFFTFHYGLFCFVHGTFIVALFGKGLESSMAGMNVAAMILPLIESRHLFWPLLALLAYQLLDWVRDISERGLGNDGIKELTIAPYRRIVVLHITILASGFALGSLNEPMLGLLLLVVFKTGMDIYHWNKDEQAATKTDMPVIDEKLKQMVDAFLENPTVRVNGKKIRYNSFEELRASRYYGQLKAMFRVIGGNSQLSAIEAYVEQREKERNREGKGL